MSKVFYTIFFVIFGWSALAQNTVNKPNKILPGHNNDILTLAASGNGELLASGGWDKNINIYTNDSLHRLLKTIPEAHLAPITALALSRDGKMLASGAADNSIRIWDSVFKLNRVLEGHTAKVTALLIDPTRRFLISGSEDRQIILWDIKVGKQLKKVDHGSVIHAFALGADGKTLYVAGAEAWIKAYIIGQWTVARILTGHTDMVNSIAISPDGKLLLSGSNDKSARLWDLSTGKEVKKLPVDCWKVQAVAFTRDGKYLATGCNDGVVRVWQTDGTKLIGSITAEGENVKGLVFNKNNETIAVGVMLRGKDDFGLRIWPTFIPKPVLPGVAPKDSLQRNSGAPLRKDSAIVQPAKNQIQSKSVTPQKPQGK